MSSCTPLRFLTYLSPGIPRAFFEVVVRAVGDALDRPVTLAVDAATSGPTPGTPDPFSRDEADVGFLCAPTYRWLRQQTTPPVALVPAAASFGDPRAAGRAVYFSDVVVRRDGPWQHESQLRCASWAYNDPCSLSGFHSLRSKMVSGAPFAGRLSASGSHAASMRMVAGGEVDAAAIDSNVLALAERADPSLARRLRVVATWGPHPIQPVVMRSALGDTTRHRIAEALLAIESDGRLRRRLDGFGSRGFTRVSEADYQ